MFLQYCKWQSPHRPKSSFLPRLTASVTFFFLQNFTNWRKIPNVKSFIVWLCPVVKDFFSTFLRHQTSYNPPNFSSLSLVLCFERSKRKRAFPKALRLAQTRVRGRKLFLGIIELKKPLLHSVILKPCLKYIYIFYNFSNKSLSIFIKCSYITMVSQFRSLLVYWWKIVTLLK